MLFIYIYNIIYIHKYMLYNITIQYITTDTTSNTLLTFYHMVDCIVSKGYVLS